MTDEMGLDQSDTLRWHVEYGIMDFEVGKTGEYDPNGSPLLVYGPSESIDNVIHTKKLLDDDDVSENGRNLPGPSNKKIVVRMASEWVCTPETRGLR